MWVASHASYMAVDGEQDTSRTRVQTYVPAYQRDEWERRAESMNMSLSEFVRTMTQAGKRGFDEAVSSDTRKKTGGDPSSSDDSGGSRLEERVLSALSTNEYCEWDELVQAIQQEFEDELGATIDDLLDEGQIEHRHGQGYALT